MNKHGALKEDVISYVKEQYNTDAEYLWAKFPGYAIFRHPNGKWYGAIMNIEKNKIGLEGDEMIDVLATKCDSILRGGLLREKGYYPAYHFNKENWITILLDGSVDKESVFMMLDMAYEMTGAKTRTANSKIIKND